MSTTFSLRLGVAALCLAALCLAPSARAQATLNQNKAEAGNFTPGDAAGFPVTISRPGSYRLTGNLVVPAGQTGIDVTVSHVTIDLNGFTIGGPVTCTKAACTPVSANARGIRQPMDQSHLVVRNGAATGFGVGIETGRRALLDGVTASQNTHIGIIVQENSQILNSNVSLNKTGGLWAIRSTVMHTVASANGGAGFVVNGSMLRFNQATDNTGAGIQANVGSGYGRTAYGQNLFHGNGTGTVLGAEATSLGGNYCNGQAC